METAKKLTEKIVPKPKADKRTLKLRKVAQEVVDYQLDELKHTLESIDSIEDPNRRLNQLGREANSIKNKMDAIKIYKEVLELL